MTAGKDDEAMLEEASVEISSDAFNEVVKSNSDSKTATEPSKSTTVAVPKPKDSPVKAKKNKSSNPLSVTTSATTAAVTSQSTRKIRKICRLRCILFTFCCCIALISLTVGLLWWKFVINDDDGLLSFATCGSCYCVLNASDAVRVCPAQPQTEWSKQNLDAWAAQKPLNPLELNNTCNPYLKSKTNTNSSATIDCELNEPQLLSGVCGLHYTSNTCKSGAYSMVTYSDNETAQAAGAFVTHVGSCGACSTTQDLSVYMRYPDLTTVLSNCAEEGVGVSANYKQQKEISVTSFQKGVKCFEGVGFTTPCAEVFMYRALNTIKYCGGECLLSDVMDKSYQGAPPLCELSKCLQCDEDFSVPIFEKFAGRTQERSGLLSSLAVPCENIATSIVQEVCPSTTSIGRI